MAAAEGGSGPRHGGWSWPRRPTPVSWGPGGEEVADAVRGGGLKAATPTPASPGPLPPSGGRLRREGGSRGVPAGAPHGATAPMPAVVLGAI